MPVPLVIIEEHHEAFYVWFEAIARGWLKASGNRLLHVDAHADNVAPQLSMPLSELELTPAAVRAFTYRELNIANFIWPAVYLGLFDEFYWLQGNPKQVQRRNQRLFTCSIGSERRQLFAGPDIAELEATGNSDRRYVLFRRIGLWQPLYYQMDTVLDICLDYFSCNEKPQLPSWSVEITADAFAELSSERLHPVSYLPGTNPRPVERNGRYFLSYEGPERTEAYGSPAGWAEIDASIAALASFLRRRQVQPRMINISRSRLSGFTPDDQWQGIEQKLLDALAGLYDLEFHDPKDWP